MQSRDDVVNSQTRDADIPQGKPVNQAGFLPDPREHPSIRETVGHGWIDNLVEDIGPMIPVLLTRSEVKVVAVNHVQSLSVSNDLYHYEVTSHHSAIRSFFATIRLNEFIAQGWISEDEVHSIEEKVFDWYVDENECPEQNDA
jgi:hypothetical protein